MLDSVVSLFKISNLMKFKPELTSAKIKEQMEIVLEDFNQQFTDSKMFEDLFSDFEWNSKKLQEVVFLVDGVTALSGDCAIALMDAFEQVS